MSYIMKRERVFEEPNLTEVPPRNEGKLKAYNSCTDTRAWSHHRSDRSEHLFELIRRNTGKCTKFIPLDVIVNTLTGAKNAEIERLKKLVEELKKLLASYEGSDRNRMNNEEMTTGARLSFAQEEVKADAESLEVNAEGDKQGYADSGPESGTEAYETGASQADSNECPESCPGFQWDEDVDEQLCDPCEKSTDAKTPEYGDSIEELRIIITQKDAELAAKANAIAILEGVIYEPYCIYARIYTFMEKLLAILRQHPKYKHFLDELTNSARFSNSDVKAKIFWKLKILERFCETLTFGCQPENKACAVDGCETECYFADMQILNPTRETFRSDQPCDVSTCGSVKNINEHRQSLVDEIMTSNDEDKYNDDLHKMRHSYDLLLEQLTDVKEERDMLEDRINHYADIENELEDLKLKLQDYTSIWDQKEHYKRRSEEMEGLTSQYMSEIAETFQAQLKAEREICDLRSDKITELVAENMRLQTETNALSLNHERTQKSMQIKIQELEGQLVLQQEEVKRLSVQCDDNLSTQKQQVSSENNDLKRQIANLKSFLDANEIEIQKHVEDIKKQQSIIHCLQEEFKRCEDKYSKMTDTNDELEKYAIGWKREATNEKDTNQELLSQIQKLNNLRRNAEEKVKQAEIEKEAILRSVDDPEHIFEDLLNKVKQLQDELNDLKESRALSAESSMFRQSEIKDEGIVRARVSEWSARNLDLDKLRGESEDPYSRKHEREDHENQLENQQNFGTDIAKQLQVKNKLLETVRQELDSVQVEYDKLRNENKKLKEITSTLQHETKTQMIQIENLVKVKDKIQESLSYSEKEKMEALKQLTQCKVKNVDLENSLHDAEYELSELKYAFDREESEKDNIFKKDDKKHERDLGYEKENLVQIDESSKLRNQEQLDEINKLHTLSEELRNSKSELEERLKMCEKDNSVTLIEYEKLRKGNDELRKQLCNAESALDIEKTSMQKTSSYLLERNKELGETIEHLDKEVKSNTALNEMSSLEMNEILQEIEKLKLEKGQNQDKINLLGNQLGAVVKVSDDQKREVEEFKYQIEELKKIISNGDGKRKDITDKLHHKENELEALLVELKTSEDENKALKKENTTLEKLHGMLEEQIQNQNREIERLVKSMEQVSDSKKLVEKAFKDSESACQNLKNKNDEIHAKLEENMVLKKDVEALQKKIHDLVETNEKLESDRNEFIKEIQSVENQRREAVIKNNVLENENMVIKNKLHMAERENYEPKWKEAEKKQMSSEILMSSQKKDIQILKKQMDDLGHAKSSTEEQLHNAENERDSALAKCDLLECDKKVLLNKLEIKNSKMSKPKHPSVENIVLEKDVETLKKNMDDLVKNNEKLESDLDEFMKEIQRIENQRREAVMKSNVLENENIFIKNQLHLAERENYESKWKEAEKKQMSSEILMSSQKKDIQILKKRMGDLGRAKSATEEQLHNVENERDSALAKCDLLESDKRDLLNKLELMENSKMSKAKNSSVVGNVAESNAQLNAETAKLKGSLQPQAQTQNEEIESLKRTIKQIASARNKFQEDSQRTQKELNEALKKCKFLESQNDVPEQDNSKTAWRSNELEEMVNALTKQVKSCQIEEQKSKDRCNEMAEKMLHLELEGKEKEAKMKDLLMELKTGENKINDLTQQLDDKEKNIQNLRLSIERLENELDAIIENSLTEGTGLEDMVAQELRNDATQVTGSPAIYNIKREVQELNSTEKRKQKPSEKLKEIMESKWLSGTSEKRRSKEGNSPNTNISTSKEILNTKIEKDNLIKEKDRLIIDKKKLEDQVELYRSQLVTLEADVDRLKDLLEKDDGLSTDIKKLEYQADLLQEQLHELNKQNILLEKQKESTEKQIKELKSELTYMHRLYSDAQNEIQTLKDNAKLLSMFDNIAHALGEHAPEAGLVNISETSNHKPDEHIGPEIISSNIESPIGPTTELDNIFILYKNAFNEIKILREQNSTLLRSVQKLNGEAINHSGMVQVEAYGESIIGSYEYNTQDRNSIRHEEGDLNSSVVERPSKSEILRDYEEKIKELEKNLELSENHFNKRMKNLQSQYENKYLETADRHMRGVEKLESIYEDTISDMIKMHVDDVDKLRRQSVENNLRALKLDKENRDMKTSFTQVESALDEIINDSYECGEAIRTLNVRKSGCGLPCLVQTKVLTLAIRPTRRSCPCPNSAKAQSPSPLQGLAQDQRRVAEENYVRSLACKLIQGKPEALDRHELSYLHGKICHVWRMKKGKDETFQQRITKVERSLAKKQKYTMGKIMNLDSLAQAVIGQRLESRPLNVEEKSEDSSI